MARVTVAAPLRQEVALEMKQDIANMIYSPGTRLIERELCERYDVSRTIIREVLRELESEGLVKNILNIGPAVAVLTPDEAVQIYEIRGMLAGLATRKFVQIASKREVAKILRIFNRVEKSVLNEDVQSVLNSISEVHDFILDTIDNEPLRSMLDRIHTRVAMLRIMTLSSPNRLSVMIKELGAVFEAIEAGDAFGAERAFIEHIACVAQVARGLLIKREAEQPTPKPMKRQATIG